MDDVARRVGGRKLRDIAVVYPLNPLKAGKTGEFAAHPGGPARALRAVADGHWLTDVVGGVQSEIRRVPDGFEVVTTNGAACQRSVFGSWREAIIHGI